MSRNRRFRTRKVVATSVVGGCIIPHSKKDLSKYRKIAVKAIKSLDYFKKLLNEVGLPIKFDYRYLEEQIRLIDSGTPDEQWIRICEPIIKGKFKGVLPRETIATCTSVLQIYIEELDRQKNGEKTRHLVIWGATQCGKTLIEALAFIMVPILEKLFNGRTCWPIVNMPSYKNQVNQHRKELTTMMGVYMNVKVCAGGVKLPFNYVEGLVDELRKQYPEQIEEERPRENRYCNGTATALVFSRNKKYSLDIDFLEKIVSKNKKYHLVVLVDENHWGTKVRGLYDMWHKKLANASHSIIGVSATPSEAWGSGSFIVIPMYLPKDFQGIACYNGVSLPTLDGFPIRMQKFMAIEDVAPNLDHCFALMKGKVFHSLEHYYAYKNHIRSKDIYQRWRQKSNEYKSRLNKEWIKKKKEFAYEIHNLVKSILSKKSPVVFLRAFVEKMPSQELMEMLEHLSNGEYRILRYFGDLEPQYNNLTIKEAIIDFFLEQNEKCLVLSAGGRSRCGDSFPKECGHYIDLTLMQLGTWNSVLQGSPGRSQGIGKDSTVYLWKRIKIQLEDFIQAGCYDNGKPMGGRDERGDENEGVIIKRRGRRKKQSVLVFT